MTRLHRTLKSRLDKAILEYDMIRKGDRILACISGGPDSLSLLKLLMERQIYPDRPFFLTALHIDLGFEEKDPRISGQIRGYFEKLRIPHQIVHTRIGEMAHAPHAGKNPCFICSHERRRHVYETAYSEGCNRIAYGHHKDDIVETLLINILFGRKIEAINPVQDVFKGTLQIIRPLMYIEESLLKRFALEEGFPSYPRLCPTDGASRRQKVKELIQDLQKGEKNANIRENIFKSLRHIHLSPF